MPAFAAPWTRIPVCGPVEMSDTTNPSVDAIATALMLRTGNYSNVTWRGLPIWQNVFDIWCCQEIVHRVRPRWILETGTNRGGSAAFFADLCKLAGFGEVITIDLENQHGQMPPGVHFFEGSSTAPEIWERVCRLVASDPGPVFVTLDSDHSCDHVRAEINLYAGLVTPGSYLVVQDTCIDTVEYLAVHRPGPLGAVQDFLASHPEFEVCPEFDGKMLISHHPGGYLRRKP